jgi:hypothetical protein
MKARLTNALSTKATSGTATSTTATSGGRGERPDEPRPLSVGDVVEVRPAEDILAGLDERGELDALPFMPEMLQFCGQRFVVDKIAFKTCDTVSWTGLRRITDTVHLAGVRCNGRAHGGCQAGCLIFWKAAWLTRVSGGDPDTDRPKKPERPETTPAGCSRERLTQVALGACRPRDPGIPADQAVYSCQATELTRAAPESIPVWDLRQYVEDVRSGNAPPRQVVRGFAIGLFNRFQDLTTRTLPEPYRFRGGLRYPFIRGTARKAPTQTLDLQPGEWVRVKSIEEITRTLDRDNRNRGLSFDREMLKYCGRTARVLRRVDYIIEEASGRMLTMKTPCIVLADVVCTADYHRNCPRGIYPYWREIWLERVPAREVAQPAGGGA